MAIRSYFKNEMNLIKKSKREKEEMHKQTIKGVEVSIIQIGVSKYLILLETGESFVLKYRPQTDQEIAMLQSELQRRREEIDTLRYYTQFI